MMKMIIIMKMIYEIALLYQIVKIGKKWRREDEKGVSLRGMSRISYEGDNNYN